MDRVRRARACIQPDSAALSGGVRMPCATKRFLLASSLLCGLGLACSPRAAKSLGMLLPRQTASAREAARSPYRGTSLHAMSVRKGGTSTSHSAPSTSTSSAPMAPAPRVSHHSTR